MFSAALLMSFEPIHFVRLSDVPLSEISEHMSDARLREHMPLLGDTWSHEDSRSFVAAKELRWTQDGLGHWGIYQGSVYVGWGGFEREGDEWDFGLVLKPDSFGVGPRATKKALEFAAADARISYVTFLLPPSRTKLGALQRLGAVFVDEVQHSGATFRKYRLDTP